MQLQIHMCGETQSGRHRSGSSPMRSIAFCFSHQRRLWHLGMPFYQSKALPTNDPIPSFLPLRVLSRTCRWTIFRCWLRTYRDDTAFVVAVRTSLSPYSSLAFHWTQASKFFRIRILLLRHPRLIHIRYPLRPLHELLPTCLLPHSIHFRRALSPVMGRSSRSSP